MIKIIYVSVNFFRLVIRFNVRVFELWIEEGKVILIKKYFFLGDCYLFGCFF